MPGSSQPSRRNDLYRMRRRFQSHIFDAGAFACSAFLAFALRFDGAIPSNLLHPMFMTMVIWVGLQSAGFIACRVNWDHWRHTCTYDAARVLAAGTAGSIVSGLVIVMLLGPWSIPRSVYILDWMLACLMPLAGRLAVRIAGMLDFISALTRARPR